MSGPRCTLDPVNGTTEVDNLQGILGIGGYEGIQNDSVGSLWIVEDVGGTTIDGAKLPNSFVYGFVPVDPGDLTKGGKLQALQVKDAHGAPITFDTATQAGTTALTPAMQQLHTYGSTFETSWVTLHDTELDGTSPYSANSLAKSKGATPFKRPENGVFRPGTSFGEFYFTETGDTNATSPANSGYGGWGAIMKLSQPAPAADTGRLTMFYAGDQAHTGLDNLAFATHTSLIGVEDAGDTLHTQRDALDSGYIFSVRSDYPAGGSPIRWLAEGRDASATLDSSYSDAKNAKDPNAAKFQNDGDNEITGIHVSDGDPGIRGILGAKPPHPFHDGWRVFWTQQHGDNVTWEVRPARQ